MCKADSFADLRKYPLVLAVLREQDEFAHQGSVEGTEWEKVWMRTAESAIQFICASFVRKGLFFLLKEAHF
jgi:hypothetical protein